MLRRYPPNPNYCYYTSNQIIVGTKPSYLYYAVANCYKEEECTRTYCQGYLNIYYLGIDMINGNSSLKHLSYIDFPEYSLSIILIYLGYGMILAYIILACLYIILELYLFKYKLLHMVNIVILYIIINNL